MRARAGLNRLILGLVLVAVAVAVFGAAAHAHPHVQITATSELIYAPDGTITGIRHAWTFDESFSSYAVQDITAKTKGVYTREELAPLAQTNAESLKEFAYFTFAKGDGRTQKFTDPVDYFMDYADAKLTLHFTLPVKAPFKAKALSLDVFDPAYFIDFQYAEKDPVKLVGAPMDCKMQLQRPNNAAAVHKPDDEDDDAERGNVGVMFANKITVDCP